MASGGYFVTLSIHCADLLVLQANFPRYKDCPIPQGVEKHICCEKRICITDRDSVVLSVINAHERRSIKLRHNDDGKGFLRVPKLNEVANLIKPGTWRKQKSSSACTKPLALYMHSNSFAKNSLVFSVDRYGLSKIGCAPGSMLIWCEVMLTSPRNPSHMSSNLVKMRVTRSRFLSGMSVLSKLSQKAFRFQIIGFIAVLVFLVMLHLWDHGAPRRRLLQQKDTQQSVETASSDIFFLLAVQKQREKKIASNHC